jgi:large repetitive protein
MKHLYLILLLIPVIILSAILIPNNKNEIDRESIISLTFDDGLLTQYENGFPLMEEYNFKGTLYMMVNKSKFFELEQRDLMDMPHVLELERAGWEIGAHSVNHPRLDLLGEEDLMYELVYPIEFFKEYGIEVKSVSYPFSRYNSKVDSLAKKHFESARLMNGGINQFNKIDFYKLKSEDVRSERDLDEMCVFIENMKYNKGWLILTFHSVEKSNLKRWDISTEDFEKILECVKNSGISVKTVEEVVSELKVPK